MNVYAGVYIQWRVSSCTHEVAIASAYQVTHLSLYSGQLRDYMSVLVATLSLQRAHTRRGVPTTMETHEHANRRTDDNIRILFGRAH